MPHSSVQLKTVTGAAIDLRVPKHASIGDIKSVLMSDYHYTAGVNLMFQGKVLKDNVDIESYPFGSVLVIGTKNMRKATAAAEASSPQYQRSSQAYGAQTYQQPTGYGRQNMSPQTPSSPAPSPASPQSRNMPPPPPGFGNGQRSPTNVRVEQESTYTPPPQMDDITVTLMIPATNAKLTVTVPGQGATVDDIKKKMLEQDKFLIGAKMVFRGKLLGNMRQELHNCGIHNGDTIHIAVGQYSNPETVMLLQVKEDYVRIKQILDTGNLNPTQRGGYIEEMMKLLYRLDSLQELPPEMKQDRRDLVKAIMEVQDKEGGVK